MNDIVLKFHFNMMSTLVPMHTRSWPSTPAPLLPPPHQVLAFNPCPSCQGHLHSHAVSALSSLTRLRRLDMYDTGGQLRLNQVG